MALKVAFAALLASASGSADHRDLHRARTRVPRPAWKGEGHDGMTGVLNGHMERMFPKVRPCRDWSSLELQELQRQLYRARHGELDDIYHRSDGRKLRRGSLEDYEAHWAEMNEHSRRHPHLAKMQRDGHCHEAVMWLVHHVPAPEQQTTFAKRAVPTLAEEKHECGHLQEEGEKALCSSYLNTYSCSDCHSGTGIPMQDYKDKDGVIPEDPKFPGMARQRRCDQNYKPACGPCEGLGGPYWGDALDKFQSTNCELVAGPEDVPEAKRVKPEFFEKMTVHQLGSDRLARTQNAGGKLTLYSQVRSTLWYDFPLQDPKGSATDGMAKLRHDTFYDDALYRFVGKGLVTEIHLQSRDERERNVTGPMVSLIHGLLGWTGGCTCLADPVGVPVLAGSVDVQGKPHASFTKDATYLGRIKMGIEYADFKLGDKGHGDMTKKRDMVVDHYVKWFLHIFMDADEKSPTYGQPLRFYGPYSGFAVYVSINKTAPPAEVWDTACVNNGWGEVDKSSCMGKKLSEYKCMNVEKVHPEVCKPYEGGAGQGAAELLKGAFGSVFMPAEEVISV